MGVVKANAYGHGMPSVARVLAGEGVRWLAVANVAEGAELRNAGFEGRVLVFASPLPEHLPAYVHYDLDVTVPSAEVAEAVATAGLNLRIHLKVDTGMGRLGVQPGEVGRIMKALNQGAGIFRTGLWTHFATADAEDRTFAYQQLERFAGVVREYGDAFETIHTANSAALLRIPESYESFERALVRPGLALYGATDWPEPDPPVRLEPVMRFVSRVAMIKDVEAGITVSYGRTWKASHPTRIATVGVGYADGYPRILSNVAHVGIRDRLYPVVGKVCMDMIMVDLGSSGGGVQVGDDVVLFGQGGPSVMEVAGQAQTIPYEICCGVSARVTRVAPEEGLEGPEAINRKNPDPGRNIIFT